MFQKLAFLQEPGSIRAMARVADLVKYAVSVREMREAAKRIGVIRPEVGSLLEQFGGFTVPTKVVQKGGRLAEALKIEAFQKALMGPEMHGQVQAALKPLIADKKLWGKLFVAKDVGKRLDPTIRPGSSRAHNLEAFTRLHEAAERAGLKNIRSSSLHGSPDVLIKDLNLLSRLTGRGSRGVKRSIGGLREPEFELLKQQMMEKLGPKAATFFEPGAKIPKAMRKAFTKRAPDITPEQGAQIMQAQHNVILDKARRMHNL